MFAKVTEKRQLPGFRFFRRGGIGAWQRRKKAPGEKPCNSEDQDLGGVIC